MKTAFAYARVSTKEQAEKRNSIPEQFNRIQKFANIENINIINTFSDSDSAFHDENRTDFNEMIQLALIQRPNFIILDDSSRLARTRQVAIETKNSLRSHGIEILYASEPNIDTNSVAGFWLEGIQEIKNEATSREIAFHTKKGMTGNLNQRDSETGWCYKNGGKAPYGYKREILHRGTNQKGKPIYKTIWELDEETSSIVRMIIVDLYTNKDMSYQSIRDYLNNHGIKNSNGGLWSTSTISSMLKQDRLEEYTGTAIWNRANNKVVGVKYNDKDNWVICENAHPAIITKEELQNALSRKEKTANNPSIIKTTSDYLLTGYNIENNFLFTCSECGGHVIGCSTGKKHQKKYRCSTNIHKGICACKNNWQIDKDWLENNVLRIIEENYICSKNTDKFVNLIYQKLINQNKEFSKQIAGIQNEIAKQEKEIQNLLTSIKNGLNSEIVINEINRLKEEQDLKKNELEKAKRNLDMKPKISKTDIEKYFHNIQNIFYNSTTYEKKELLKTFIYSISLKPLEHQIEIIPIFQWFPMLEQVAGIEPA